MLPKLEEITITNGLLRNCLKQSWPSLRTLRTGNEFDEGEEIFFVLDPQIRRLVLSGSGIHNLEAAADHLPNLEQLSLWHFAERTGFEEYDKVIQLQRFTIFDRIGIG